jgi:CRISPR-associated protein Cas1
LFTAKKVNKAHIDEITNGVTLNKEGKELLIKALNEYLEEDSIRYKNRNQTRQISCSKRALCKFPKNSTD